MASNSMLKSNRLKQVFGAARRPAMGFWQMLPGANVSRVLARAGVDWVMVDCEHGNIDGKGVGPRGGLVWVLCGGLISCAYLVELC